MHEERLKDLVIEEAYRGVTVRDGDRSVTVPMAQAILRSMAVNAAKGQHRAQRLFAELLASVESSRKLLHDEYFEKALTYKLEWEKELNRRAQHGITHLPDPLPHPNQVKIDMRDGTVHLVGPLTLEEKAELDYWRGQKPLIREAIANLRDDLIETDDPERRASIEHHISRGEHMLEQIETAIPDDGEF